jgi:hypothetical protein
MGLLKSVMSGTSLASNLERFSGHSMQISTVSMWQPSLVWSGLLLLAQDVQLAWAAAIDVTRGLDR